VTAVIEILYVPAVKTFVKGPVENNPVESIV